MKVKNNRVAGLITIIRKKYDVSMVYSNMYCNYANKRERSSMFFRSCAILTINSIFLGNDPILFASLILIDVTPVCQ
jgi:hypothetical protein